MKGPPGFPGGPLLLSLKERRLRPVAGRNGDPDHLAAAAREAREHRFDQARNDYVEPVGFGPRLGAAVEQRLAGARAPNVEIDLAVIFDIAVDSPAAIPERVVPAVVEGRAEAAIAAEARIERRAEPAVTVAAVAAVGEGVLDDARLAVID